MARVCALLCSLSLSLSFSLSFLTLPSHHASLSGSRIGPLGGRAIAHGLRTNKALTFLKYSTPFSLTHDWFGVRLAPPWPLQKFDTDAVSKAMPLAERRAASWRKAC